MSRKLVEETIVNFGCDFAIPLDEFLDRIESAKREGDYGNIRISMEHIYDDYYNPSLKLIVIATRLETEQEASAREQAEKARKERMAARAKARKAKAQKNLAKEQKKLEKSLAQTQKKLADVQAKLNKSGSKQVKQQARSIIEDII